MAEKNGYEMANGSIQWRAEMIVQRREQAIAAAITRKIGDGWKKEYLEGRCQCIVREEVENYYLDGELILVLQTPLCTKMPAQGGQSAGQCA